MNKLQKLISTLGDEQAARLFGVSKRAAEAYRLGERIPKRQVAKVIVEKTRLSYNDIYA